MGLTYRRRQRVGKNTTINYSGSGASVSQKVGKRVTINSRGQVSIRLGAGYTYRLNIFRLFR